LTKLLIKRQEGAMKVFSALGLLLVAILAAPPASLAFEVRGARHAIPCFQCSPDIVQSFHVVRTTATASVVLQVNIYDVNGLVLGSAVFVDLAGTFLGQQVAFTTTQALTQTGLPNGLYAAILFDASLAADLFYEQIGLNAGGVAGILTGRGTGPGITPYNYFSTAAGGVFALTLVPETQFNVVNFFVCNNPANNMATFLGVPGPSPGQQGVAQLVTADGIVVLNTFVTQSLFARRVTDISPGGQNGGSLFLNPPGATIMACVKFIRIGGDGTVGGYTL